MIKAHTAEDSCRYLDAGLIPKDHIGKPDYYICHAWDNPFSLMVDSVRHTHGGGFAGRGRSVGGLGGWPIAHGGCRQGAQCGRVHAALGGGAYRARDNAFSHGVMDDSVCRQVRGLS